MRSALPLFHITALLVHASLGAQQIPEPRLLLDINQTSTRYSQSSVPEGMTADHDGFWRQARFAKVGSYLFLSARVADSGRELYYATADRGSALMAADINPGSADSNPSNFLVIGNKLYFTADDGTNGYQVWEAVVTGGGVAVQRLTSLSETGSGTAIGPMIAKNSGNTDVIYFTKYDSTAGSYLIHGVEVPGGTPVPVSANLTKHWSDPVVLGDHIVFEGTDFRGTEAWWLDSVQNTGVLRDYNAGDGNCEFPVVVGDAVYFSAYEGGPWGLYSWDRQSPVARLATLPAEWWKPVVLGTKIVFLAGVSAHSIDTADQAPAIQPLPNELAGNTFKSPYGNPVVMGDKVYYYGYSMVQPVHGYYLFESDGLTAQLIPGTRHGSVGSIWNSPEVVNNSEIFFNFTASSSGFTLYTFDGNTFERLQINRVSNRSANPSNLTVIDGKVCFSADDGRFGNELWISDGTQEGTVLHTNIATQMRNDGSFPRHFAASGRRLMFSANDGVRGIEPWFTDGRGLVEGPGQGTWGLDLRAGPMSSDPQATKGIEGHWISVVELASGYEVVSTDAYASLSFPTEVEPVGGVEVSEQAARTNSYTFYGRYLTTFGEDQREPLGTTWASRYASQTNTLEPVLAGVGNSLNEVWGDWFVDVQEDFRHVNEDGSHTQIVTPDDVDINANWLFPNDAPGSTSSANSLPENLFYTREVPGATDAPTLPSAASYNLRTQAIETFFTGSARWDNVFWQPFPVADGAAFLATVGNNDYLHWTDGTKANTGQISPTAIYGLDSFENTVTQREGWALELGQTDEMIAFPYTDAGLEVWKVDGSSATRVGTLILDDVAVAIPLGSHRVAFVGTTQATGWEVFVTDGVEILNISEVLAPGPVSGADHRDTGLWAMDGKLYFSGIDPLGVGTELYTWDAGALAQPYGVGTSSVIRLRAHDPMIGNAAHFEITGAPDSSALGFVVFAPPAPSPFLFAGERVYVDVAQATTLSMSMAQGEGTLQFPIPNDAALVGARLDIQGAVGPFANAAAAALTGAQSLTVGR